MVEWLCRSTIFLTLVGGEWSASRPGRFTPGEIVPGTLWIGSWVGPRAGLDDVEKRKSLTLPRLELRPLGRPARSRSLYRLSYLGSLISKVVVHIVPNVLYIQPISPMCPGWPRMSHHLCLYRKWHISPSSLFKAAALPVFISLTPPLQARIGSCLYILHIRGEVNWMSQEAATAYPGSSLKRQRNMDEKLRRFPAPESESLRTYAIQRAGSLILPLDTFASFRGESDWGNGILYFVSQELLGWI
jgi:hypothetical protein